MQPPFFNPKADDAVNYGGMGGAIGHEITHGFDDEGRQFDSQGNLSGWWTEHGYQGIQPAGRGGEKAVRRLRGDRLTAREREADFGGEHRRSRRALISHGAYRRSLAGETRAAAHRWLDRRSALLPGVGADLASKGASGVHPTHGQRGSARASQVPNQSVRCRTFLHLLRRSAASRAIPWFVRSPSARRSGNALAAPPTAVDGGLPPAGRPPPLMPLLSPPPELRACGGGELGRSACARCGLESGARAA